MTVNAASKYHRKKNAKRYFAGTLWSVFGFFKYL